MRNVIRPFNARMSVGLKPTIREVCSDGDIVVIFFDATGTAGDSKPYTNNYFWLFECTTVRSQRRPRCSTVLSSIISGASACGVAAHETDGTTICVGIPARR
jgi:hypothetical protein